MFALIQFLFVHRNTNSILSLCVISDNMVFDKIPEFAKSKFDDSKDLFRETPVRYLGYSNELGEAFRPLISKSLVNFSYVVATGYVLADTYSKASRIYNTPVALGGGTKKAAIKAGDVLLWQMLASVIIPGFTINRICWGTGRLLKMAKAAKAVRKTAPTAVGLASIPLIIHPIDKLMDYVMDNTYRKYI